MRQVAVCIVALSVFSAATGCLTAGEPKPNVDELLEKWTLTTSARRASHATFTRIEYLAPRLRAKDAGASERRTTGQFYVDRRGHGFYNVDGQLSIVWSANDVCFVDLVEKTYCRFSRDDLTIAHREADAFDRLPPLVQFIQWYRALAKLPLGFEEIDDVLPLVNATEMRTVRLRFDLTATAEKETTFLFARPKFAEDRERWRQVDLALTPDGSKLLAIRVSMAHAGPLESRPRSVVHLFEWLPDDKPPADVDEQMHPNLVGFRNLSGQPSQSAAP